MENAFADLQSGTCRLVWLHKNHTDEPSNQAELTCLLSTGQAALVDAADYTLIASQKWHCQKGSHTYYAARKTGEGKTYLHRLVLDGPQGIVDHINGCGLDCRRANLRIATKSQNNANQVKTRGTSCYKGVGFHRPRGKWRAFIKHEGNQQSLGHFWREEDAATAYNFAAHDLFGEFANYNTKNEVNHA